LVTSKRPIAAIASIRTHKARSWRSIGVKRGLRVILYGFDEHTPHTTTSTDDTDFDGLFILFSCAVNLLAHIFTLKSSIIIRKV
jgi:hypothetical protein